MKLNAVELVQVDVQTADDVFGELNGGFRAEEYYKAAVKVLTQSPEYAKMLTSAEEFGLQADAVQSGIVIGIKAATLLLERPIEFIAT